MQTAAEREPTVQDVMMQETGSNIMLESANEDMMFDNTDITYELAYLDKDMITNNMSSHHLAGQELVYSFNRWGQLDINLGDYKLKGRTKRYIIERLHIDYSTVTGIRDTTAKGWTFYDALLLDNETPVKFLYRNSTMIGCFKPDIDVSRTITFYETAVYKSIVRKGLSKTHKIRDFKPEWRGEDDVYAKQEPEFTKENELEEIRSFINGLKGRRLSNDERSLLNEIVSEIETL